MPNVIAAPELLWAAANNLAAIGSALTEGDCWRWSHQWGPSERMRLLWGSS